MINYIGNGGDIADGEKIERINFQTYNSHKLYVFCSMFSSDPEDIVLLFLYY